MSWCGDDIDAMQEAVSVSAAGGSMLAFGSSTSYIN